VGAVPSYAARARVQRALDIESTSRAATQLDEALAAGSRNVDKLCHRVFYPTVATRTFDWPNTQRAPAWRLWLDQNELAGPPTEVTSGGVALDLADVYPRPDHGPPYTYLELNRATVGGFTSGSTPQRAISMTAPYGFDLTERPAGALAEALDSSETGVDVTDASVIGPGSLLKVDSERMIVTDAGMVDTGLTVGGSGLVAAASSVTLTASGSGLLAGEVLLVDSERMLVTGVVSTAVTVKRAWDGTPLAAHSVGASVYAARSLTVERGALGTTAATHSSAAVIYRHVFPAPVVSLTVAYAIQELMGASSGYSGTRGGGESGQSADAGAVTTLENRVWAAYGRKARTRAV
jgi:hypothetical protein